MDREEVSGGRSSCSRIKRNIKEQTEKQTPHGRVRGNSRWTKADVHGGPGRLKKKVRNTSLYSSHRPQSQSTTFSHWQSVVMTNRTSLVQSRHLDHHMDNLSSIEITVTKTQKIIIIRSANKTGERKHTRHQQKSICLAGLAGLGASDARSPPEVLIFPFLSRILRIFI